GACTGGLAEPLDLVLHCRGVGEVLDGRARLARQDPELVVRHRVEVARPHAGVRPALTSRRRVARVSGLALVRAKLPVLGKVVLRVPRAREVVAQADRVPDLVELNPLDRLTKKILVDAVATLLDAQV